MPHATGGAPDPLPLASFTLTLVDKGVPPAPLPILGGGRGLDKDNSPPAAGIFDRFTSEDLLIVVPN